MIPIHDLSVCFENNLAGNLIESITLINERTIDGLGPIQTDPYWIGSDSDGKTRTHQAKKYHFPVFFNGNKVSFTYNNKQLAQQWHEFIEEFLENN